MITTWFVLGASLFALLIVDICCFPVKGSNPGASKGSSKMNNAPNFDFYQEGPSGKFSSGAVVSNNAPPKGISTPMYKPEPQPGPSVSEFTVQKGPAPSVGSSSSGPIFLGNRGNSVKQNPASSAQPEATFQSGPQDVYWAAAPSGLFSGSEKKSTGTRGVVSSQPENVSPPRSLYQAGELSFYEQSHEHGNSERETDEQGWQPYRPLPMPPSAGQGFASPPRPVFNMGGGLSPYHYYDFIFLTGQYPPGTFSHASSSYEQGRDYWQDEHYVRDSVPSNPGPAQQVQTFTGDFAAPRSIKDPRMPVESPEMASHGQGGARAGLPASFPRSFRQPSRWPNYAY